MTDMLVKLYNLPELYPTRSKLLVRGIEIRRPFAFEKGILIPWVAKHFQDRWATQCGATLDRDPVNCFIAIEKQPVPEPDDDPYNLPPEKILGFACFDAAYRGMFGPIGVQESYQGRGIGKGLLLTSLHAMKEQSYTYAVIWWIGPAEFYAKTVGAVPIDGSAPGFNRGPLIGD